MKKNFMTRVLAVAMSAAMALSMATATNLTVAEAAAKPAMSSKSFTVRVGSAAKTYRATAATRKAYKIVKASAGNANKATAEIIKAGKAISVAAGTKTGKTTITLTFKNRTTGVKKTLKFAGKVVAAKKVASMTVAQKKADQLELTMGEALTEAPAASKITITREDNVSVSVKAVEIKKEDAKVLVVDTYTGMADGKKYTVTLDKLSADFTATDGVVADVALNKTEIPVNKLTEVKVQELDKNGIIILEGGLANTGDTRLTVSVESTDGYVQDSSVIIYTAGNKAKATITYAGTYDATGAYTGEIKKDVTITAVAGLLSVDNFVMTVGGNGNTRPAFGAASFKAENAISIGDEATKALWFCIKDNEGDEVKDYYNYKVSSSNSDVLILSEVSLDAGECVPVTPLKAGTCYIVVKKDGAVIKTLPITVQDQRKVSSVSIVTGTMNAVDNPASSLDSAELAPSTTAAFVVKDQYGKKINGSSLDTVAVTYYKVGTNASETLNSSAATEFVPNKNAGTITYTNGTLSATGTYMIKVEPKVTTNTNADGYAKSSATTYLTVVNKERSTDATPTAGLYATSNTINTTITNESNALFMNAAITPVIYQGAYADTEIPATYVKSVVVKNPKGQTIAKYETGDSRPVTGAGLALTNTGVQIGTTGTTVTLKAAQTYTSGSDTVWVKNLAAGTYTIEYVLDGTYNFTSSGGSTAKSFTWDNKKLTTTVSVTDAQDPVTFKVLSSNADNDSACGWSQNENKVEFYYDGLTYVGTESVTDDTSTPGNLAGGAPYVKANTNSSTGVDTAKINFANVKVKVANTASTYMMVPVSIGVVLSNCQG